MKPSGSRAAFILEKVVFILPLLIGLGIVVSSYLSQTAFGTQAEKAAVEREGPIVPALLPPGEGLFQISPLPTNTWTPQASPPTNTPISQQPTNTPAPPTATSTPLPPTPTNTLAPPTATSTPLPSTPTNTPVSPTATSTPVPNQPPLIIDIAFPSDPVHIGQQPVTVAGVFTDPNPIDTHTALWDWGDGSASQCPSECNLDQVNDEVTGSHTYIDTGVYLISLTITDSGNLSTTEAGGFVVIYDPSGGFVTGGGWINSPAGAYRPDPALSGRANFAFNSKYKKGAAVPAGNTVFVFKAGDLNFNSDSYQWLVINQAGQNAQFKGIGTINGAVSPTGEQYSFMVWAMDKNLDTFRLKIWYETPSGEEIVYDNGFKQPIEGGSIVVHTGN